MIQRIVPWVAAAVLCLAAVPPPRASACMPGFWHPRQDAIILWHDGVEVLIWRTLVSNRPPPGANVAPNAARPTGALASHLEEPSTPIAFEIQELDPFERTLTWAASHEEPEPPGSGGGPVGGRGDGEGGIQVGATQTVGDYEVTPITGTGTAASAALAQWLRSNHFPAANETAVRTYVAQNATFLAVKARYPANADSAKLRPLAIAFRSDRIVVPVKLSAGEPAYSLGVTIFSSRRPEDDGRLTQGMRVRRVITPGRMPGTPNPGAPTVQVPHVSIPAAMRALASRMVARVPQLTRMENGALWLMRISAEPLTPDATSAIADPSVGLGIPAHAGNDTPPVEAVAPSGTTPTPPAGRVDIPPGPPPPSTPPPEPAGEDGSCSVSGPGIAVAAGLPAMLIVVAAGVLRLRRRRR